ncbi:MAG: hypothetical protein DRP54_05845 [Spirochaetes bacterium]|nr:MAG: hypothetical protein DRP54_05845 [Spirochaetota bacterium]
MITVNITLKQNLLHSFTVTGHGEFPAGKDIVCAGVSSISQTILGILLEYFGKNINYIKEKGFLKVEIVNAEILNVDTYNSHTLDQKKSKIVLEVITRTFLIGLNYISNSRPGSITITVKEL